MRLTTKSEYSLLALVTLARAKNGRYIKLSEICDKYKISHKYLDQLFITLRKKGLIVSKRGEHGGYRLGKKADKIYLADIIRIMDGALAPIDSVSKYFYAHSPLEKEKSILKIFKDIRDYVSNKLEKQKLSDFI